MTVFSQTSLNTIRVVTMYTRTESVIILGATLRCGVGDAVVDNWSAGGVAVGIDCEEGRLKKYAFDKHGSRYSRHPTTGCAFEGFTVPEWPAIVDVATRIQKLFTMYRLLGMDIAVREDGKPVLIEVNNNTDLMFQEQTSGPLLRRDVVLQAFGEYGLFVNRHQQRLYEQFTGQRHHVPATSCS